MVLHGIYDNGKIVLTDKELPNIKVEVDIIIEYDKVDKLKQNRWDNILKLVNDNKVNIGTISWTRDSLYDR